MLNKENHEELNEKTQDHKKRIDALESLVKKNAEDFAIKLKTINREPANVHIEHKTVATGGKGGGLNDTDLEPIKEKID